MKLKRGLGALLVASMLPLCAGAAPADDVKALLDQGKPAEAYTRRLLADTPSLEAAAEAAESN